MELNQSYPDITLLPIIASYFNISIDELLGYEPFMNDDEVKELYSKLIKEFSTEEFDIVYEKCIQYEKEYYTCYFLQFHLGLLYCNHAYLAFEEEKIMEVYSHATEVFKRIEEGKINVKVLLQHNTYSETLEESKGKFEIRNNKYIYVRDEIIKEDKRIKIPTVSSFKIENKKLILENNYLSKYTDKVILIGLK